MKKCKHCGLEGNERKCIYNPENKSCFVCLWLGHGCNFEKLYWDINYGHKSMKQTLKKNHDHFVKKTCRDFTLALDLYKNNCVWCGERFLEDCPAMDIVYHNQNCIYHRLNHCCAGCNYFNFDDGFPSCDNEKSPMFEEGIPGMIKNCDYRE